jgi:cytochrome P450
VGEQGRVVDPSPPLVTGRVPWVGAGMRLLRDPTGFFADTRRQVGDTFLVEAFGYHLLCVFSAAGVRSLYALPESQASFGLATYTLLSRKVPTELFGDIRNPPHKLFGSKDVEGYLDSLCEAVAVEIDDLGAEGSFELFARMRTLGHRLGLASWAGRDAASEPYFSRLAKLLDRLDSAEAFVRPGRSFATWATRKTLERRAMHELERIIGEIWTERQRRGVEEHDFLEEIYASFADVDGTRRLTLTARDVIVLHLGSQSNLYAALAWTLANLLLRPDDAARVRGGDVALLERYAYESIRMAQRSITLRQVLRPLTLDAGDGVYDVAPGVMITTMLSVTNTTSGPGLDTFDPAHYDGRRLDPDIALETKELVSTFGHGSHSCPAQRFSISAIRTAVQSLLEQYDLTPRFSSLQPKRRQLGAVARAETPAIVDYRARRPASA